MAQVDRDCCSIYHKQSEVLYCHRSIRMRCFLINLRHSCRSRVLCVCCRSNRTPTLQRRVSSRRGTSFSRTRSSTVVWLAGFVGRQRSRLAAHQVEDESSRHHDDQAHPVPCTQRITKYCSSSQCGPGVRREQRDVEERRVGVLQEVRRQHVHGHEAHHEASQVKLDPPRGTPTHWIQPDQLQCSAPLEHEHLHHAHGSAKGPHPAQVLPGPSPPPDQRLLRDIVAGIQNRPEHAQHVAESPLATLRPLRGRRARRGCQSEHLLRERARRRHARRG